MMGLTLAFPSAVQAEPGKPECEMTVSERAYVRSVQNTVREYLETREVDESEPLASLIPITGFTRFDLAVFCAQLVSNVSAAELSLVLALESLRMCNEAASRGLAYDCSDQAQAVGEAQRDAANAWWALEETCSELFD